MGRQIIDALKEAVAGDFASVTVEGKTFMRRDWQPIETAPEGEWVLVARGGEQGVAFHRRGEWHLGGLMRFAAPTHWLPLPAPPSPEIGE